MLTHERLKELLHYDPETGVTTWLQDRRAGRNHAFLIVKAGDRAGFYGTYGYRYVVVDGFRTAEHRMAWFYMTGELPPRGMDIDHLNGTRDDNRWANLRSASRSVNMQNSKRAHRDSQTGFLGVEVNRDRFAARICINGKKISLGCYDTPEQAHAAYLVAKRTMHEGCTI